MVATAEVLPLNAEEPIDNEPIKKAQELRDNTYSVQKKGGDVQIFSLTEEESQWYVSRSKLDRTKESIRLWVLDEDPKLSTTGWGGSEIPTTLVNKLITINQQFLAEYPWFEASFGTMRTGSSIEAMIYGNNGGGDGGPVGNVKQDGSSQILLKEKPGSKAYAGDYQLLFIFNYTQEDEEYTIAANATVHHVVPELYGFSVNPPSGSEWIKTSTSLTMDVEWTDGAEFDPAKIKLANQTKGGVYSTMQDEGYFSWDAATGKLTSLKSAGNEKVYLIFTYPNPKAGTDGAEEVLKAACQIAVGPGWSYTSFSVSPESWVVQQGSFHYDSQTFYVETWAPKDGSYFSYYSLELDPASDYYEKLYYNPDSHYVSFSNIPNGTFNVILRCKSNHDVKCTVPVRLVDWKVRSFTIKPHEFYLGYGGAGQVLDVEYTPADATWDWSDVELGTNAELFKYYPSTHTISINTLAPHADAHELGVQVKFQLKSNENVYDYVYVNMNQ